MLLISKSGIVDAERVKVKIFPGLERTPMLKVNGIVVHQTNSSTSGSTFAHYQKAGAHGAHFLIDKDGTIYQTASVYKRTNHVGWLKSRCLETRQCAPAEFRDAQRIKGIKKLSAYEHKKESPARYPGNNDSIGIEVVGREIGKVEGYEAVNEAQNRSLRWLVRELAETLGVSMREVHKHPDISYKKQSEARSAKWQD